MREYSAIFFRANPVWGGTILVLFGILALPLKSAEVVRPWTVPGRPPVSAQLTAKTADSVTLRTADGKEYVVPIARLSAEDQNYIASANLTPAPTAEPAPPSVPGGVGGVFSDWKVGQPLNPAMVAALAAALEKSIQEKDWTPYRDLTREGIRQVLGAHRPDLGIDNYMKVLAEPTLHRLLVHERFLSRVPEAALNSLLADPETTTPFLRRLMDKPAAMENFLQAVDPKDDAGKVFDMWRKCWEADPEVRDSHANLAIALALVFDRPQFAAQPKGSERKEIDGLARFQNFVTASREGKLKTQLEQMPVYELIWVVGANVSDDDLDWARRHLRLTQQRWGETYKMVKYLMERATDDTEPYTTYTLEEILDIGGVCRDQAHFAANSARALGIPAYVVSGDGDRGGHAWLGYKANRGEWGSRTGRYPGYRTGHSTSPQTGERVREQMFYLWNELDFHDLTLFRSGQRLAWLSEIYRDMKHAEGELGLARFAFTTASHVPATSNRLIEALGNYPAATQAHWKSLVADLRRVFREHPDILAKAAELERQHIPLEGNEEELLAAIASERRSMQRKDSERSDIVVMLYHREADLQVRLGKLNEVMPIYKKAFGDLAGDIPAFKQLATDLVSFTKGDAALKEKALKLIDDEYESSVVSGSAEYFRVESEKSVAELIKKLKGA